MRESQVIYPFVTSEVKIHFIVFIDDGDDDEQMAMLDKKSNVT